jgi:hypothetical protein
MKKLSSLAALGALLYAMPMNADIPQGLFDYIAFGNDPSMRMLSLIFIGLISINIQALLFSLFVKNVSYFEGMFLAFLSHVVCYAPEYELPALYNHVLNTIISPLESLQTYWFSLALQILTIAIAHSILMIIGIALAKFVNGLYRKPLFEFPSIRETWMPIVLGNIIIYALLLMLKIVAGY